MENERQWGPVTLRGVRWLLLYVFYLRFLVPLLLEKVWGHFFLFPMPDELMMLLIQLLAVALPMAAYLYLSSADPRQAMRLFPIRPAPAVVCAVLGLSAQPLASLLNIPALLLMREKLGALPPTAVETPHNLPALAVGLVTVAILPAIFEELLMRGVVLSATEGCGYRASLLIGGLYFTLLHSQVESTPGHFFLGVLLCYVVWMTGSVWGGMITHFFFNAGGMVTDYLTTNAAARIPFLGTERFYWINAGTSILVFLLFFGTLSRRRVRRNRSRRLVLQLLRAVLNLPVLLMLGGYALFYAVRFL